MEDFSGENTSDMVGKIENSIPQCVNQLIGSVSLPLTFCFFCFCRLGRKLQESQESMTSRLEEAEHKAKSLQTGTSLVIFFEWQLKSVVAFI